MLKRTSNTVKRLAIKPFFWFDKRVFKMTGPVKENIVECEAKGEDICTGVWSEFMSTQRRLLPYRLSRFSEECKALITNEGGVISPNMYNFIWMLRFGTKCLVIFMIAVMLGRRSFFPPLAYNSPFIDEVLDNWSPNKLKRLPGEVGDTLYQVKKKIVEFQVDNVNAVGGLIKSK